MKSRGSMSVWCGIGILILAVMAPGRAAAAEHDEHAAGKDEPIPDTYGKAVAEIEERRDNIAKLIEQGKLDGLHSEGEVIKKIAEVLPKLASKEGSGVAKDDIKEINLTSKALAAKYEPLDTAGDAGKKDDSKKVFDEMVKLIATLKKFVK